MKRLFALLSVAIITLALTSCSLFQPKKDVVEPEDLISKEKIVTTSIEIVEEEPVAVETSPETFELNAVLKDVTAGSASGTAGASYIDDEYYLFAEFENLPTLENDFFYEGWVVKQSPLSVISTGKAINSNGAFTNKFTSKDDLLDHTFYVLTLEPDDGDPAPAVHVLEGTMI